jgi:hypothetical protein
MDLPEQTYSGTDSRKAMPPIWIFVDRVLLVCWSALMLGVLWLARHPGFYYLDWFVVMSLLWCVTALLSLAQAALRSLLRIPNGLLSLWPRWRTMWLALILFSFACAFKIPMRLAFLTLRPQLEKVVATTPPENFTSLPDDFVSPLFRISAEATNRQHEWNREGHYNTNKILFMLDDEAAFIYSPTGIADLVYNEGAKGHLMGNWYWMKAD